ncbi:MAG TPA: hypothetical protein VEC38_12670 [Candidatus Binataceae bacterium]|nr:hypothetical protein [Candidatus Binataceae bacterium]
MENSEHQSGARVEIEGLGFLGHLKEVVLGILTSLGLAILWLFEIIRNGYFSILDRINLKPRRRARASAFPPGRPRKRRAT